MVLVKIIFLTDRRYACELLHQARKFYLELYCFTGWDVNKCWTSEIQNVGSQLCSFVPTLQFVVFPCVLFSIESKSL